MASRRVELLRLIGALVLELAELDAAAEAPSPPAPPSAPRRRRPVRLGPVLEDDAPVSDLASKRAERALLNLGIKP